MAQRRKQKGGISWELLGIVAVLAVFLVGFIFWAALPEDRIVDPDRWQPITFTRPDGSTFTPGCLTPHWGRVKPFALNSPEQFRAEPPPTTRTDDAELRRQTERVLRMNCELTPEQKAQVEFMRDGPRSTGQSGHWLRFAQDVSRRDGNDLDTDVNHCGRCGRVCPPVADGESSCINGECALRACAD